MIRVKLTDHFFLDEFLVSETADELGISNDPTEQHLSRIRGILAPGCEEVRDICGGRATVITSAYRNPKVNKAVGGTATSDHPNAYAADLRFAGISCFVAARLIAKAMKSGAMRHKVDQLILESGRQIVHVSFNPRARGMMGHQPGAAGTAIDWNYFRSV